METPGVFIRSVGERTEELANEAVRRCVGEDKVHVIKNQMPAWRAYDEMFRMALDKKYEWYLGLDADVVLAEDWLDVMMGQLAIIDPSKVYDVSFPMVDYFSGVVDKGNHLFNGGRTELARKILLESTKDSLKPESGIFSHMPELNSYYFESLKPVGWHGFEQYRKDIYYRFYLLGARGKQLKVLSEIEEKELAELAWRDGRRIWLRNFLKRVVTGWRGLGPDASLRDKFVLESIGWEELSELDMSLDNFRKKFEQKRQSERPDYDMNRGVEKVWLRRE